jgi:hypothetical protein
MPGLSSVFRWLRQHADFRAQYDNARTVGADTLFDEMLDIADETRSDWIERKDTSRAGSAEYIRSAKLRIDTRKYMVGIINRKKYSAKADPKGEAEAPVTFKVVREILLPKKKEEQ